jgi:hypothetical protein
MQRSGKRPFEGSPNEQFNETLFQKVLHKNRAGGVDQSEGLSSSLSTAINNSVKTF